MLIAKVMYLYNTELCYTNGMEVIYFGKKFYNIGP